MPFITEELWQHLKEESARAALPASEAMETEALVSASWPEYLPGERRPEVEENMDLLQEIVRAVRSLKKEKGLHDRTAVSVVISTPDEPTDRTIERHRGFLEQMAVLEEMEHGVRADKPPRCVTVVVGTIEVFVLLEGLIDLEAEQQRLKKQRADVERRIEAVEQTLHNSQFRSNAPDEVVQQKMDAAEELRAELSTIIQNLADLQ
jgi:valyl-tRNA synthetase